MKGLGKTLQEARHARGLTLDEAGRMTQILPGRLQEIENDDFSGFTTLAYAKEFVLIYGNLLDVDVTPYLEPFETSALLDAKRYDSERYDYLREVSSPSMTLLLAARKQIKERCFAQLRELFAASSPSVVGEVFNELLTAEKVLVIRLLPRELGAHLFGSLNTWEQRKLTAPPRSFRGFEDVQELSLYRNKLRALPDSIRQLSKLQRLSLDDNGFATLPNALGELRELRELYLDDNALATLPACIGRLREIRVLSVRNNRLSTLPEWLLGLPNLQTLDLRGNPNLGLPDEVLGSNQAKYIISYYLRTHPSATAAEPGGKPLLEARIIVIGDGASGKTSLVRQLLRNLPARPEEASTRDVLVEEWPVILKSKQVRVNLWDFGGQNQMHAAHPYFFTTRTLYLLVAEARKDQQDRVDYWLTMISKYGQRARALVVVNKIEGHAIALDRPTLLANYRNNLPEDSSRAFFPTSCTDGTGISALRKAILKELEAMDQIWALWPAEWFQVKESIRELQQPKNSGHWIQRFLNLSPANRQQGGDGTDTLNYSTWRSICNECGVIKEEDRDQLLENLAHLGQVICFPSDPRLRPLGVLNPEWVTRGIYSLLVDTTLAAKGGILSMEDLADLLPSDRYPKERHAWLVDLMKSFDLIFEDDRGRLLLPGQLPTDSPAWAQSEHWLGGDVLHLELRYDVLPESVISAFIVRRHKEARRSGEWWRHGIALRRATCEALVRAHVTKQAAKIELRLRGPRSERHELLTSIRETLRDPKDTTPPDLYVILGRDCVQKYNDLLLHAENNQELDFIMEGRSVRLPLAPILDMIETPTHQNDSRQAVQFQVNIKNENRPDMSHNTTQTIDFGSGNTITDVNVIAARTIRESFGRIADANISQDLRDALKDLHKAVAEMSKQLPESKQVETAKTLETLSEEALSQAPRKKWYELSAEGLVEAAKAAGELAAPVITAVKTVLTLLG